MYATEFKTIIDKPYIEIPNYEEFKGHEVRVVLLNIDSSGKHKIKDVEEDFFTKIVKNPKHLKDVKFLSREEANER